MPNWDQNSNYSQNFSTGITKLKDIERNQEPFNFVDLINDHQVNNNKRARDKISDDIGLYKEYYEKHTDMVVMRSLLENLDYILNNIFKN